MEGLLESDVEVGTDYSVILQENLMNKDKLSSALIALET